MSNPHVPLVPLRHARRLDRAGAPDAPRAPRCASTNYTAGWDDAPRTVAGRTALWRYLVAIVLGGLVVLWLGPQLIHAAAPRSGQTPERFTCRRSRPLA